MIPLVLALISGCDRLPAEPPAGTVRVPQSTCSDGLLALDDLGRDPSGPEAPSITETFAVDETGALAVVRREVSERVGDRPVRTRVTHFAAGCPVLEVETWYAPAHGAPLRQEQRVFDPDAAWMISPYAPPPRDEITTWTLDGGGRALSRERDVDADGTVDVSEASEYDAAGRLLHRLVDVRSEGDPSLLESLRELTYVYDPDGNAVVEETRSALYDGTSWVTRIERDFDDGRLTSALRFEEGVLRREEYRTWDGDRPLTRDVHTATSHTSARWAWRADGSTVITSTEAELGVVWREEVEVLDPAGRRLRFEQDQPFDGFVDWVEEDTWRPDGQQLTLVQRSHTPGGGVEVYADTSWSYDAAGRPVEALTLHGWRPSRTVWTYAGRDELTSVYDLDGVLLTEQLTVRDADGRAVLEAWDGDGDGADDRISEWRHDADGRRYASLHDHDADGVVDQAVLSSFAPIAWE